MKTHVYITGLAGMIGFHLAKKLSDEGYLVTGCDNFNDYYEVSLKRTRARILQEQYGIVVTEADIIDPSTYDAWNENKPDVVMHLAAYANPRHSLANPQMYIDTNITGTQRLIEACEAHGVDNVVYASSSCVMHGQPLPWKEDDRPGHQNNPYGWSKRTNECQFKHSKIKRTVGLRFFTVYGPYGRPDMALFLFTKAIINGTPLIAYNNGNMVRDFTYVDDIVNGVEAVINKVLKDERMLKEYPSNFFSDQQTYHDIFNIGRGEQVQLMDFIRYISEEVGKHPVIDFQPPHPADVPATWADTTKLKKATGYQPQTSIKEGVKHFVKWYLDYYGV